MVNRTPKTPARTLRSGSSVKDAPDIPGVVRPDLGGAVLDAWRKEHLCPPRPGMTYSIGARNPYALAERMYALTHDGEMPPAWVDTHENPQAWQSNRRQLMSIFHSIPSWEEITYEKLFDPGHYKISPLFSPLFSIQIKKLPVTMRAALSVQPSSAAGTAAQPCSDYGTHWDTYKIPGTTNKAPYYRRVNGTPGDIIDDIVQGCSKDCWFMAALASNTWTNYTTFPPDKAATTLKDTYTITFYESDGTARDSTVDSTLTLDAGNLPVFARPSSLNEVWPAIYEKAYGVFWRLAQSALPYTGDYPNHPRPHIPGFPYGDPLNALQHIKSGSIAYHDTANNHGACFNLMQPAMASNGTSQTTRYPMVAYSYYDAAAANQANNTTWITYDNEIIVANHSYSILGTVTANTKKYIVLRNPYGRLWGADPNHGALTDYLYTGRWTPTTNFYRDMTINDGVFALQDTRFEYYFTRFGWVH